MLGKKEIIRILMERDDLTKEEAREEYQEGMEWVMAEIEEGRFMSAEEAFMDYFGLEVDYLLGVLLDF